MERDLAMRASACVPMPQITEPFSNTAVAPMMSCGGEGDAGSEARAKVTACRGIATVGMESLFKLSMDLERVWERPDGGRTKTTLKKRPAPAAWVSKFATMRL